MQDFLKKEEELLKKQFNHLNDKDYIIATLTDALHTHNIRLTAHFVAMALHMKNTKTSLDDNDWNNRNIGYNQALDDLIKKITT